MSLFEEMDAYAAQLPTTRMESFTTVPVKYHADLENLIDHSAGEYWQANPRGNYKGFRELLVPRLGQLATNAEVQERARIAFREYATATRRGVEQRANSGPVFFSAFRDTSERDADRALADDLENYNSRGSAGKTPNPVVESQVRQRAEALADYNERVIPQVFRQMDAGFSEERRKELLTKYRAGDTETRDFVKRLVSGKLDTDEALAKHFDKAMSEGYIGKSGLWNNTLGRGLFRGVANFSSRIVGLIPGQGKDQYDLRNELASGVGVAQDRTGANFADRVIDDGIAGATESILTSGAGAGLGHAIGGTAAASMIGSGALAGTTTAGDSYQKARSMGMAAPKALAYGLTQGGLEAGLEVLGNKLFGPGLEAAWVSKTLDDVTETANKALIKQLGAKTGRAILEEMPSEVATTISQRLVDWTANVDPSALDPDKLAADIGSTIAQTILTVGVSQTGRGTYDLWQNYKQRQAQNREDRRALPTFEISDASKEQAAEPQPQEQTVSSATAESNTAPANSVEGEPAVPDAQLVTDPGAAVSELPAQDSELPAQQAEAPSATPAEVPAQNPAPAAAAEAATAGPVEIGKIAQGTPVRFTLTSGREVIGQKGKFDLEADGVAFPPGQIASVEVLTPEQAQAAAAEATKPTDETPAAIEPEPDPDLPAEDVEEKPAPSTLPPPKPRRKIGLSSEPRAEAAASTAVAEPPSKTYRVSPFRKPVDDSDKTVRNPEAEPVNRPSLPEANRPGRKERDDGPMPEYLELMVDDENFKKELVRRARSQVKGTTRDPFILADDTIKALKRLWTTFDLERGKGKDPEDKLIQWAASKMRTVFDGYNTAQSKFDQQIQSTDVNEDDENKNISRSLGNDGKAKRADGTAIKKENQNRLREAYAAELEKLPKKEREAILALEDPEDATPLQKKVMAKLKKTLSQEFDDSDLAYIGPAGGYVGPQPAQANPDPLSRESSDIPRTLEGNEPVVPFDKLMAVPPPIMLQLAKEMGIKVSLFSQKAKNGGYIAGWARKKFNVGPNLDGLPPTIEFQIGLNKYAMSHEQFAAWVLAHEIGHIVDHQGIEETPIKGSGYSGDLTARGNILGHIQGINGAIATFIADQKTTVNSSLYQINRELLKLSEWWRAPFTEKGRTLDYRTSDNELYGDAVSVLLNAPGELEQRAPMFYKSFLAYLNNHPEFAKSYVNAQNALQNNGPVGDGYWQLYKDMMKAGEDIIKAAHEARLKAASDHRVGFIQNLITAHLDSQYAVSKGARDRGMMENVYNLERQFTTDSAESVYVYKQTKLLNEARDKGFDEDDFGTMLAFENIAYGNRGNLGAANPLAFGPQTSSEAIDAFRKRVGEAKASELRAFTKAYRENFSELMQQRYDAGLTTPELMKVIRENPFYSPIVVHKYLSDQVPATIKAGTGTINDAANNATTMLLKGISTIRQIDRNIAARAAVDTYEAMARDNGHKMKVVLFNEAYQRTEKPAPHMDWVYFAKSGVWYAAEVPKSIAETQQKTDDAQKRAASTWNKIQYGIFFPVHIGKNLAFSIANPIRDFHKTLITSKTLIEGLTGEKQNAVKYPFKFAYQWFMSLPDAYSFAVGRPNANALQAMEDRVISTKKRNLRDVLMPDGSQPGTIERLQAEYGQGTQVSRTPTWRNAPLYAWEAIMKAFDVLVSIPEATTKIAGAKMLRAKGFTSRQIAYYGNNQIGTPNYRKSGTDGGTINALLMYGRVSLNGLMSQVEMVQNPKLRRAYIKNQMIYTVAPIIASGLLTSGLVAAAYAAARGLEEDDEDDPIYNYFKMCKRCGDKISPWLRGTSIVIPLRSFKDENGDEQFLYLTPPIDQGNRGIGIVTRYAMDEAFNRDRAAGEGDRFASALGELASSAVPGLSTPINMGNVVAQYLFGNNPVDPFRNQNIIPRNNQEAGGLERAKPVAAWLANQFGAISNLASPLIEWAFGAPFEGGKPNNMNATLKTLPTSQILRSTTGSLNQVQRAEVSRQRQLDAAFLLSLPEEVQKLKSQRNAAHHNVEGGTENELELHRKAILDQWHSANLRLQKQLKLHEQANNAEAVEDLRKAMLGVAAAANEQLGALKPAE